MFLSPPLSYHANSEMLPSTCLACSTFSIIPFSQKPDIRSGKKCSEAWYEIARQPLEPVYSNCRSAEKGWVI